MAVHSSEDVDFLLANGEIVEQLGDPHRGHLRSRISLTNYARIADEIAGRLPPGARVLDWGCGYGHVSYLLMRRHLDVVSYDIGRAPAEPSLPLTRALRVVVGDHPVRLPFASNSFEAVLSCGVLEHVIDEDASLRELHRILRVGGHLFVYNLPQERSYKELLIRRWGTGPTHDRRYTLGSVRALFARNDFRIVSAARGGMLPHLATGLPTSARRLYDRVARLVVPLDRWLSRLPAVNRIAQSLEINAVAGAGHHASYKTSSEVTVQR